jgi:hypothetical protein
MKESLASADGDADWTGRNAALQRTLLRMDRYVKPEPAPPAEERAKAASSDTEK